MHERDLVAHSWWGSPWNQTPTPNHGNIVFHETSPCYQMTWASFPWRGLAGTNQNGTALTLNPFRGGHDEKEYPLQILKLKWHILCSSQSREWKMESKSLSVVSDSLWPHGLCSSWSSPGQNAGVGNLFLFQGIFPTQGLNPGFLHRRRILYQLSHKGSPSRERERW